VKNEWRGAASACDLQQGEQVSRRARAGFLFTFDDGTADHYFTVAPILERYGVRGIFYVSTALVGRAGYLTLAQCREMQARGHAIESHGHEHKALLGAAESELSGQLALSRQLLKDNGLGQWSLLAVAGGYADARVAQAARAQGYRSLRTLQWGYNRKWNSFFIESICVNRSIAGVWYRPMLSARGEAAKKSVYRFKEILKTGVPSAYFFLRSLGSQHANLH
jgi:peptidoglycan/xylan/chitin deacetylase (PgdA/CDA1 family)